MVLYNVYIFNRKGVCLYYREWNNEKHAEAEEKDAEQVAEERRLVFGMLYSMKEIIAQMASQKPSDGLLTLKTDSFTMHNFETVSGTRFVLNTDNGAGDLRPNLRHIFANIWVECVAKSPLHNPLSDKAVDSPLFDKALGSYVESLSCFR